MTNTTFYSTTISYSFLLFYHERYMEGPHGIQNNMQRKLVFLRVKKDDFLHPIFLQSKSKDIRYPWTPVHLIVTM